MLGRGWGMQHLVVFNWNSHNISKKLQAGTKLIGLGGKDWKTPVDSKGRWEWGGLAHSFVYTSRFPPLSRGAARVVFLPAAWTHLFVFISICKQQPRASFAFTLSSAAGTAAETRASAHPAAWGMGNSWVGTPPIPWGAQVKQAKHRTHRHSEAFPSAWERCWNVAAIAAGSTSCKLPSCEWAKGSWFYLWGCMSLISILHPLLKKTSFFSETLKLSNVGQQIAMDQLPKQLSFSTGSVTNSLTKLAIVHQGY